VVSLYKALGGGWQREPGATSASTDARHPGQDVANGNEER
jgi:hypothetical protein